MPVTNNAMTPTQSSGPVAPVYGGAGMPGFNLPTVTTPGVDSKSLTSSPQQVFDLLANAPTSLTSILAPLLQQVYGAQGNLMKPVFDQQGAQGAAIAQSDAMKRGLTGSSIEASSIGQAYNQANQGYNQYIAQMLQNLIPQFSNAANFDIQNSQHYYDALAQAVGQDYASKVQMDQFNRQMDAGNAAADADRKAQMWAALIGGAGQVGAGAIKAGVI